MLLNRLACGWTITRGCRSVGAREMGARLPVQWKADGQNGIACIDHRHAQSGDAICVCLPACRHWAIAGQKMPQRHGGTLRQDRQGTTLLEGLREGQVPAGAPLIRFGPSSATTIAAGLVESRGVADARQSARPARFGPIALYMRYRGHWSFGGCLGQPTWPNGNRTWQEKGGEGDWKGHENLCSNTAT